jgi:cobalamin synthase
MEERVQPLTEQPKDEANPPPPAPAAPQYEFTDRQNEVMKQLDWKLGATGGFVILAAIAMAIVLVTELIKGTMPWLSWTAAGAAVIVVLAFAHGGWLVNASSAFQKVHTTQGRDVDHVMEALHNLSRFFTLVAVTALVIIAGCLIRAIMGLFS